MSNRRTGKIARLPKELRDVVNLMLQDGAPYAAIIEKLADHGHADINEQNVTNWKDGGYQDWCNEQSRLDDMRAKREFALEIVAQNDGSKLHEATLHLAASQLYEALTEFDLGRLKQLLADAPENYAAIVNSLAKLSKQALDIERYKDLVRQRKAAIEAELTRAKSGGGLTVDTIQAIEAQLKLL